MNIDLALNLSDLERDGIVIKTRRAGKQDMFKLNTGSEKVKLLMKFDEMLINYSINEAANKSYVFKDQEKPTRNVNLVL